MSNLSNWQLFLFVVALVAAWAGILLGVMKSMLADCVKPLAEKIDCLQRGSEKIQGFERQILELKADLPLNYVRKEDFIRHEVVINTKLDRLRDLLEDMKEKRNA